MNRLFWNMSKNLWERNSFDDFYKVDPLKLEKRQKEKKKKELEVKKEDFSTLQQP